MKKPEACPLITPEAVRLSRIERLLRRDPHVTTATLLQTLGVSPATVKRDLVALREIGAPIRFDKDVGGYRLAGEWRGVGALIAEQLEST